MGTYSVAHYIEEISMKRISKRVIIRIVASLCILVAIVVAYYAIVNWRAQCTYNAATNNLIANMKAARSIDSDKEVLLTQQQQTNAQFEEARAQRIILMPKLVSNIDHNAALSYELTALLKKKIYNEHASSSQRKNQQQRQNGTQSSQRSQPSQKNKDSQTQQDPRLNDEQRNKVEHLLQQNNHVDQQSLQDERNQEKTTKRTQSGDEDTKPW